MDEWCSGGVGEGSGGGVRTYGRRTDEAAAERVTVDGWAEDATRRGANGTDWFAFDLSARARATTPLSLSRSLSLNSLAS